MSFQRTRLMQDLQNDISFFSSEDNRYKIATSRLGFIAVSNGYFLTLYSRIKEGINKCGESLRFNSQINSISFCNYYSYNGKIDPYLCVATSDSQIYIIDIFINDIIAEFKLSSNATFIIWSTFASNQLFVVRELENLYLLACLTPKELSNFRFDIVILWTLLFNFSAKKTSFSPNKQSLFITGSQQYSLVTNNLSEPIIQKSGLMASTIHDSGYFPNYNAIYILSESTLFLSMNTIEKTLSYFL